jgi:hypothetical protein
VKFVVVDELYAAFLNESRTRGRRLGPRTGNPGPPNFSVKFAVVDELYAAFLNESRTHGRCLGRRTGNPGNRFAVGDERSGLV